MSEDPKVSRWRHFRDSLSRQSRGRSKDTIAIAVLAALGDRDDALDLHPAESVAAVLGAARRRRIRPHHRRVHTAQAVTPGQGQAVDIAGIQVGKITSVDLEDGHAVVGMDIEPKYLELIHPDATLLLRPKTNLNDMVVEVDPGQRQGPHRRRRQLPALADRIEHQPRRLPRHPRRRHPPVHPAAASPAAPRASAAAATSSPAPSAASSPSSTTSPTSTGRSPSAASRSPGVIHDFGLLTTELGRRDAEIERFVTGSKAALGNFANQQQAIQETLVEFPSTLTALQAALASSNRFSIAARPALIGLIPQAQALGPALKANERFFEQTTAPIRDQIRPFTRQIRPVLTHAKQGSADLEEDACAASATRSAPSTASSTSSPTSRRAKQSYLFYLPWLNHNLNATFNLDDPAGPIQRGLVMISCNGTELAYGAASDKALPRRPCSRGRRIPRKDELPPIAPTQATPQALGCGPGTNEQARAQHNPAPRHRRLRAVLLRHPALPLDHLRRPDALQGEVVRDRDPLQRGDPARPAVRRADLRRLRRQSPGHRPRAHGKLALATIDDRRQVRADPARTRGRSCAPRRCSPRPTSN